MYLSVYVQYMICFNLCFFQRGENYSKPTTRTNIFDWKNYRKDRVAVSDGSRDRGEILAFSSWMGKLSNEELATFREETTLRPWKIAKLASQTFRSMGIADVRALLLPADPPPAALPRTRWSKLAITRAEIFMELYNLIESHSSSNFELWENISRASIY